jgi:LmbE family N-acetylglucosaminyl deacetylase
MNYNRALIITPHPDDDILGAGGYIKKLSESGCEVKVLTVSGHLPPLYSEDAFATTVKEAAKAHALVGVAHSHYLKIPATTIGDVPISELNAKVIDAVNTFKPSLVLCPYPDRHIDHRLVFDAAMVATRPVGAGANIRLLAAYETLSETHWNAPHIEANFVPNWVVDITETIEVKKQALSCFVSQISPFPGPRSIEAVEALSIFRGTQSGFAYGEAFHIIRMVS